MAGKVLGFTQKRRQLYARSVSPEKLMRAGDDFLEAGRYDDALNFYHRAEAKDRIAKVAETAVARGDAALLLRARKLLGTAATPEELSETAAKALENGKPTLAMVAYERIGDKEKAKEIRAQLGLSPPKKAIEKQKKEDETEVAE
ncbi:MAG TPA: hypothetical protein PL033_15250 [Candidatus Brocadiia bacterium]|nr:hypothetical protein [Candidatus Brocadiia bacterium]